LRTDQGPHLPVPGKREGLLQSKLAVAAIATTGICAPANRRIDALTSSRPGRSEGTDLGSSSNPASPVLNHTRCETFPGSIATTSADPGNACFNKPKPTALTSSAPTLRTRWHNRSRAISYASRVRISDYR
jgi:hypothetical protein